jgi:hypothetical protein
VGQELFSQFYEKPIFWVRSYDQFQRLAGLLSDAGYRELLFLTPYFDQRRGGQVVSRISDEGLGFWHLQFVLMNLPSYPR